MNEIKNILLRTLRKKLLGLLPTSGLFRCFKSLGKPLRIFMVCVTWLVKRLLRRTPLRSVLNKGRARRPARGESAARGAIIRSAAISNQSASERRPAVLKYWRQAGG